MPIAVENVSYTYLPGTPFEHQALKNVSFTIEDGEFVGIIGHTGSGKSTLIQIISSLIPQTAGRVLIDGVDYSQKDADKKKLRRTVGVVFQYPEYQLFAETVADDVAFGLKNFLKLSPEETKNAVKEALETVGLSYETYREKSPFELSGGQKRRVAIAGVIVTKPEILVLDEPVAGLDPQGKKEFFALLHALHRSFVKTVIIISHDMDDVAEHASRVAVFDHGSVFRVAAPRELFSESAEELVRLGLDLPVTGWLKQDLNRAGIGIETDFTAADFAEKAAALYGGAE